ncbi:OtnA protein [Vibrio sp. V27_P1S3P104]|uniref:SLBB domain-containing protein n=2 Tax=Vibrio TaxID=662 RepID=UPI0013726C98|nr:MULTISPECIES: SLBB domain-containing protein [unclassified Vibrio]NAW68167.1 OtnA protein [Vibrio sp. V28_P6S34P95]NAX03968.1 OtnA protein [Vibrio sp. V30_P3S12P165]NAX35199.1 OtnA protein [Vibrio sp. V29_P1S30P107]NAX37957.1 OtnA protein [Vibrio sp. V27_P1S3P104]NAX41170.1 OtnA protein [Vibrio sp. V26_P1S5P106]
MFDRRFTFFAPLLLCMLTSQVYAQGPTAAQISMFQNLPTAQKQALAKEYGIDLSQGVSSPTEKHEEVKTQEPRETDTEHDLNDQDKNSKEVQANRLKRFGVNLFASSPSTFAPTNDSPVPSDYPIGPGDEIVVQLFGKENLIHRLRVNREGVINFPSLGPISVAGLSFSEVRASLSQRVQEQMIGVRSDITLGELRSMQIFVMGESYKPGAYTVSALTTISQAIYHSGGFSKSGALRNIQLKRHGQVVQTLDMYDLLLKGDTSADVRLMPGDVVWIAPVADVAVIEGQIQRPAIYEIKPGSTYQDLITIAGGLRVNAFAERSQLKRLLPGESVELRDVNLTEINTLNQPVHHGDVLTVATRTNPLTNVVQITGDVTHPGVVEWQEGMTVSDIFQSQDSAFNPSADLDYALLVREVNHQRDIKVLQFNLADALLNPSSSNNLVLSNGDQLVVFSRRGGDRDNGTAVEIVQSLDEAERQAQKDKQATDKQLALGADRSSNSRRALLAPILLRLQQQARYGEPAAIVELVGELRYPGRYPITQKQDLNSLLIAAGGLTSNAYTDRAELTRAAINQTDYHANIEQINLNAVLSGEAQVIVQPRDRLSVFERPEIQHQYTITLQGEVKFPGIYTIRRGETLAQLLQRAGGLTEFAHPQGAIFTREALRQQEQKLLSQYAADMRREVAKKTFNADSRVSNVINDPDKTLAFIEEATKQRALGRMVVQLDQIIDGYAGANFMLEDGDFLFVPTYRNTVSIMGEVQVGITYLLDPSLTVDDYINRAGGMKKQADDDRIFVVRADGSVFKPNTGFWFGRRNEALKPGDTIVVPVDTDYRDALNVWTAATQILYQTGVAVNALK